MYKNVLLTGADGFIGSHLTEKLVAEGYNVSALVKYNSQNSWGWLDTAPKEIKDNVNVIPGDIRDPHFVNTVTKNQNYVVHLAALIAIPYSYIAPMSYVETNVSGTLNLLQASRNSNVETFVQTSTSEVYGTAKYVPIDEKHPLQGQSPYSASKIGSDMIAESFYRSFDVPVKIIRPFNTYGPRQSARAVIPTIISQINSGARTIRMGDLSPTRDFNYIDDTVSGFCSALKSENGFGEAINIGSNYEISIEHTIKLIANLMDTEIEVEQDVTRLRPPKSEVQRLWCDNSKARDTLNWSPAYSGIAGFSEGLRKTIAWFSLESNLKFYKSGIYNL